MGAGSRFFLSFVFILSFAGFAYGQCAGQPTIPNLVLANTPSEYILDWDAPAGIASPVYEIVQRTAPEYCSFTEGPEEGEVIATTSATSYTGVKSLPNTAYLIRVRVQGNPCVTSTFVAAVDSFPNPPSRPVTYSVDATGGSVTISLDYSDEKAVSIWLYRVTDQAYVDVVSPCAYPKVLVDSDPPQSGTHQYLLIAFNTGNSAGLAGVASDPIQVTMGSAPPRVSFSATPRLIRAGGSAKLVWSADGAASVSITGLGSRPAHGTETVSPSQTTTYTLTASNGAGVATESVTIDVITAPQITLKSLPDTIVQGSGTGGAMTSYILQNSGGTATTINLSQAGDFFSQSPARFELQPGESQRVTVTGESRATGSYRGASIPSGSGVPPDLRIPISLLAVPAPEGETGARAENARVDVSGPEGSNPSGSVTFVNMGEVLLQGTAVSTVPWLIPQEGLIEVAPGESVDVSFTIDRSRRPAGAGLGSVEGAIKLVFRSGTAAKGIVLHDGVPVSTTLVTVVDTSRPDVEPGQIPPLGAGEVALFVPGAGHLEGGSGLFFSDIALINLDGDEPLRDVDLYYTPSGGQQTLGATVSSLAAATPLVFGDAIKTVFESESTLGSLQIRASDIERLGVNANILLRTRGENQQFYGNTIPVLRSDRSAGPGESMFITGLTSTDQSHTNLFIQETNGGDVSVDLEFLDESGQTLGVRGDVVVGPFRLLGLFHSPSSPTLPVGAVSAMITSSPQSTGRFGAYATPVDRRSGDTWSLVDWNAVREFSGDEEMIIPVAGAVLGNNNLYFRTDLSIINRSSGAASGILKYISGPTEGRPPIERVINLGSHESRVIEDVTSTLFGIDSATRTLGYLIFTPTSGSMTVTSRNFATQGNDPGTFGTGVPTLARASSLRLGDVRRIGSVSDAAAETISSRIPDSYRSNFGMMETSGTAPATVRVTVYFSYVSSTTAIARGNASKEYVLDPNEYIQLGRVSREVLGASRDDYGDFDNLQVEFAVVDGEGAVAVYVSSVENNSGDSTLRVE